MRPQTVWSLEGDNLVERAGPKERCWNLADLRQFRLAGLTGAPRRAVVLTFARGRCVIASHSWRGPGGFDDRMESFAPLVRAIAETAAEAAPRAHFATAGLEVGEAFAWVLCLLGAGIVALLVASISAGAASLGITLASHLLFVLILMLAARPWLKGRTATIDPRAIPPALLPLM